MSYNFRAREQQRREQRAADERRMRRMFWLGLIVPAVACTIAALIVGPNSWLGWAAVVVTARPLRQGSRWRSCSRTGRPHAGSPPHDDGPARTPERGRTTRARRSC